MQKGLLITEVEVVVHLIEVLDVFSIRQWLAQERLGWKSRRKCTVLFRKGVFEIQNALTMNKIQLPRGNDHG